MARKARQDTAPDQGSGAKVGDKGYTGNPGGQPKWVKDVRDALKECAPLAAKRLHEVLSSPATEPKVLVKAAEIVFAYSVPKPKQEVSVEGEIKSPFSQLTPEQLVAIATGKPLEVVHNRPGEDKP